MATLTSYLTPGPFQPGSSTDRRTTYRAPGPLQPQLVTSVTYNVTGSGGLTLGGTATASLAYSVTGSGGLTLGGTATSSAAYSITGSGGLVLGGTVSTAPAFSVVGSGGLTLSGSGSISSAYTITANGGLTLAGTATSSASYTITANGGLTLGGSATSRLAFNVTASGGLTLGGSATSVLAFSVVASGGLTLAGSATVALVTPEDLYESLVLTCYGSPTLTSLFGRIGWLWIEEAPDGEQFPYAVLSQPDSDLSFETFSNDGTEPAIESATYQISIFSQDRQLNRTISAAINTLLDSAALNHNDGYLMGLRIESQTDLLDPDRGPQGVDVWQRVVRLDVRDGHNQTVVTAIYTPTPAATDLADALIAMLASDSTLAGSDYFGRSDWLWIQEAPDGQALPYAVLMQKESKRHQESNANDGTRPVIEDSTYELHVFASSRAICRTLGERIGSLVDGAAITFGDGYPMYLRRQSDTDTLDDDRSRLGADVWRRVVTLTAITGHTE